MLKFKKYLIIILLFLSEIGFCQTNIDSYNTLTFNTDSSIIKTTYRDNWDYDVTMAQNVIYYWTRSGKIFTTQFAFDGKPIHGVYKEYTKDGKLIYLGEINDGRKNGIWKEWYSNGKLKKVENYYMGVLNGYSTTWDLNGIVIIKGKYRMGYKHGEFVYINDTSTTYKEFRYGIERTDSSRKHSLKNFVRKFLLR